MTGRAHRLIVVVVFVLFATSVWQMRSYQGPLLPSSGLGFVFALLPNIVFMFFLAAAMTLLASSRAPRSTISLVDRWLLFSIIFSAPSAVAYVRSTVGMTYTVAIFVEFALIAFLQAWHMDQKASRSLSTGPWSNQPTKTP